MDAMNHGVVHLRVDDRRVLELWTRRLSAELGEPGDSLCIQTTNDKRVRRQAIGDSSGSHQARGSYAIGRLRSLVGANPHSKINQKGWRGDVRRAERDLPIVDMNIGVGIATCWYPESRRIEDGRLVLAIDTKHADLGVEGV